MQPSFSNSELNARLKSMQEAVNKTKSEHKTASKELDKVTNNL